VNSSPEAGSLLEDNSSGSAPRAPGAASGPKAWPSADRESPAGPIQILSIPSQPPPPVTRPGNRAPQASPRTHPARASAPAAERTADPHATSRPPLAQSLGALAFGLFELQQPDPLVDLRTLKQARDKPGHGREDEHRGRGHRADAFALLGEIDFLDF
jgi:hypothetical protein